MTGNLLNWLRNQRLIDEHNNGREKIGSAWHGNFDLISLASTGHSDAAPMPAHKSYMMLQSECALLACACGGAAGKAAAASPPLQVRLTAAK